jgi:hypothetical protein
MEDGGVDFHSIEIYELSTVSVPALPEAIITSVKSMRELSLKDVREISRFDAAAKRGTVPIIRAQKPDEMAFTERGTLKIHRA